MQKYVILGSWTDQGIKSAKDTVDRAGAVRKLLESVGGSMETILWTTGRYDFVAITTAPDPETLVATLIKVAGQGNVRTETLTAFGEEEMKGIIGKIPA